MKQFLGGFAMKEERNDLLFHSIKMETGNNEIITVANHEEKEERLDRLSGMIWVEESATPKYLL